MRKSEQKRKLLITQIKNHWIDSDLKQLYLAGVIGCTPSHISNVLNGKYNPGFDSIIEICEAIGLEVVIKEKISK
jgi:transcriptional regulator with XRE-family HTH domain